MGGGPLRKHTMYIRGTLPARPLAMAPLRVDIDIPPEARSGPGEIRFLPSGATTGGRIVLAGATGIRVMTVSRVTGALRRGDAVP